jgi:hypothetical protein
VVLTGNEADIGALASHARQVLVQLIDELGLTAPRSALDTNSRAVGCCVLYNVRMATSAGDLTVDLSIREAAMAYVGEHARRSGGVVTRPQLEAFRYEGEQIKLIDQCRGIRNPRQLQATIGVLSSPRGPYDDVETQDGLLRYAYRAGDPVGSDNRKLRAA